MAALASLTIAVVALLASTLHLGRPIHAIRALKMWRRSWLSREVLFFSLFTASATAYSADLWLTAQGSWTLGLLTCILGLCGVGASARLYLVPGRPTWNSPFTILEFLATAALGCVGTAIVEGSAYSAGSLLWLTVLALGVLSASKLAWLARSRTHELRGSWQLLSTILSTRTFLRFLLIVAGAVLMTSTSGSWAQALGVCLIVAGEFMSRYLFFVSVVPTNMASGYLAQEAA